MRELFDDSVRHSGSAVAGETVTVSVQAGKEGVYCASAGAEGGAVPFGGGSACPAMAVAKVKLPSVVCGFLVIKLKACLCGSIMVERSRFGDCLPGVFICFIPYGCLSLVSASRSGAWNWGLCSGIVRASLPQLYELDRQAHELDEYAGNDERHVVLLACGSRERASATSSPWVAVSPLVRREPISGVSRSRSGSLVRLVEHGHVEATI